MIFKDLKKRFLTGILLLLLLYLIFNFKIILIYSLIIIGVVSVLEFLHISNKIFKNKTYLVLSNIFFIIYLYSLLVTFFFISNIFGLKLLIYVLLLTCVASDLGGYIFGKIFRGPKLTKISPNKTYSGAIGSIFFSIFIVSITSIYFLNFLNLKLIFVAFATSIFCQLGDLLISFLKRKAKLKDTGNFLPGHGGILDRIDGIIFGLPIGFITFILIN